MHVVPLHRSATRRKNDPAWIRVMVIAPAAVALVLLGGAPVIRNTIRRVLKGPQRSEPLSSLRSSILGNCKTRIRSMLGPPRASGEATWYYPLCGQEKLAMAISFDGDQARAVEFFHAPRSP